MAHSSSLGYSLHLARSIADELDDFKPKPQAAIAPSVAATDDPLGEYDQRISNLELRTATRSRFASQHYADAVESGVKALNECVRAKANSTLDGDPLMTGVFSEKNPKLRINRLRSDSDRSEQRGHMMMCQGVVAAWRNPRAHSSQFEDSPTKTLMMLEYLQHLIEVTKASVRVRKR